MRTYGKLRPRLSAKAEGRVDRSDTARRLMRVWNLQVKHALYRKTGDWYHQLEKFPGALLDEHGYVIFPTEDAFRTSPYLQIRQDVGVRGGIKQIPGYVNVSERTAIEASPTDPSGQQFIEGDRSDVVQSAIERDPAAREACILAHGCACAVCGFDFEKRYGPIGKGFIHVHHLRPLAEGVRSVNPIEDLRPVCPNCHAMIHQRTPPYELAELKDWLSGT